MKIKYGKSIIIVQRNVMFLSGWSDLIYLEID